MFICCGGMAIFYSMSIVGEAPEHRLARIDRFRQMQIKTQRNSITFVEVRLGWMIVET